MAVACVGLAAEPKVVWRQSSFPTKHRVKHTCEPCGRSNCEIYTRCCQGFKRNKNQGGKGVQLLEWALLLRLSPLFPLLGAGLLLHCVVAAATVGSWPPRVSHRVSAAFTMAAAVLWLPALTVSHMDGAAAGKQGTWPEKDQCQEKRQEEDVVLASP